MIEIIVAILVAYIIIESLPEIILFGAYIVAFAALIAGAGILAVVIGNFFG